jgi:hypothetical protein
VQEFLDRIGKLVYAKVHLYRQLSDGSLMRVNDSNLEYIKPDIGYGSVLQPYLIKRGDTTITSFCLYEFPSCCAFCVSTQVEVTPPHRRLGINKIGNQLRQWIAKEMRYSALICTDVDANIAERKTLIGNGFQDVFKIKNQRTGNIVNISVKPLV